MASNRPNQVSGDAERQVEGGRTLGPARAVAVGLEAAAVLATTVLVTTGHAVALPLIFGVFVLAVALFTNRVTVFPNELAATGEMAVFLCAVVLFRDDSPFLAPVLLGLVSGWLDRYHWESRAFLRMTYNSGNRALASLAAAGAFALTVSIVEPSGPGLFLAAVAGAAAFVCADLVMTVGLTLTLGEPSVRGALRRAATTDLFSFPLALYGAGVGFLAGVIPWWLALLVLVPAAFVPELVLGLSERPSVPWMQYGSRLLLGTIVLLTIVGTGVIGGLGGAAFALLLVLSVLAGIELAIDRRLAVPPLVCSLVVVVLAFDRKVLASALGVALLCAGTAWVVAWRRPSPIRVLLVALTATGAAVAVSGVVADTSSAGSASSRSVAASMLAALAFSVVAILLGSGRRRAEASTTAWALPLPCAMIACGLLAEWSAPWAVIAAVVTLPVVAFATAWWGTPPWRSRRIGRIVVARRFRGHWPGLCAVLAVAVGSAAVAPPWLPARSARAIPVIVAFGLVEVALAMVLSGVHQWRFGRWSRRRDAVLLVATSAGVALAYPEPALRGRPVSLVVIMVAAGCAICIGRPLARLAAAAVERAEPSPDRPRPRSPEGSRG